MLVAESTIPTPVSKCLTTHKLFTGNNACMLSSHTFLILSPRHQPYCLLLTLLYTLYQSCIKLLLMQTEHLVLLLLHSKSTRLAKHSVSSPHLPTLDEFFEYHFGNLDVSDASHCLHNELLYIICIHTAVKQTKITDTNIRLFTKISADVSTVSRAFMPVCL